MHDEFTCTGTQEMRAVRVSHPSCMFAFNFGLSFATTMHFSSQVALSLYFSFFISSFFPLPPWFLDCQFYTMCGQRECVAIPIPIIRKVPVVFTSSVSNST